MLKEGIGDDIYHTHFRNLSSKDGRWWSPDPEESSFPWRSPYVSMGNNPIKLIDPLENKEYESAKQYKEETGKDWSESSQSDWLIRDRLSENDRWNSANLYNLENKKVNEYTSIEQRTGFYKWLAPVVREKGFEIKWVEGGAKVSGLVLKITQLPEAFGLVKSESLEEFANKGNKKIFDDIIPQIADLLQKEPLKGEAAKKWDSKMVRYEQTLIQPEFESLGFWDYLKLSTIMKSNSLNIKHGNSLVPYVNGLYKESEFGVHRFPLTGDISNIEDRYNYGMKLLGY